MDAAKRRRVESQGWKVGNVQELFKLSDEQTAFIEIKARLAVALAKLRSRQQLTQVEVARKLGSSQSRLAKMESADKTVSLDLLVRSLLTLGANRHEIAEVLLGT